MFQAILNVLAIIVLSLAAGFIILLLVDLTLGCIDGKRGVLFFKNRRNSDRDNEILLQYNKNINTNDSYYLQNNQKNLTLDFDKEYEKENQAKTNNNIDFVKADAEEKLIAQKNQIILDQPKAKEEPVVQEENDFTFINKVSPEIEKEIEEEQKTNKSQVVASKVELNELDEDKNFDYIDDEDEDDKSIEEILKAIKERNMRARNKFLEEDEEADLGDDIVEGSEDQIKEVEEEKVPLNNDNEELDKLKSLVDELNKKLEEEQRINAEISEKAKRDIENLQKELDNKPEAKEEITEETLKDLENQLAVLLERQKQNEKDLKLNKKEYIPLARIARTLESDQNKLRRREAIVAKKKMVVLGVNNVADPEKLQKLDEEVDLLEGLKMSVEHCQEVMNANKDRYPVLQRTYEILVRNGEDISSDIKAVEAKIEYAKQVLGTSGNDGTQE